MKSYTYVYASTDLDKRLDKVLASGLELSRTRVQELLRNGFVTCNGKPLTAKSKPDLGAVIEVSEPDARPAELTPKEMPLDILFEDKYMIVLNKAPGVVVHPAAGNWDDTLVSALLFHCRGKLSGINGVERPGIVHRLDKDTSGVLVVAKDDESHQNLSAQFKARETEKYYLAYVSPPPSSGIGSWLAPIGRHPHQRQKMMALRDKEAGRSARTDYKILKDYRRAALLELRIHTGRTHQIRVHCAFAGCPVIGDTLYGRNIPWVKEAGVKRQLLHAQRLVLDHPAKGKRMEFIAPVPDDFVKFEKFLTTEGH
ncbi:MAG: RluA family pseudouridine synthase [Verrucomicrobiales bacterium]|jgi:23S rRNA pseudouridine1911/1915/1917 synthase|nr:RluA family pseudouridine synthase [Verrucomicrobiales bacterium]